MAGSTFAGELRTCLGEMLRSRAPEVPADVEDPLRFFTQWLAGRRRRLPLACLEHLRPP